MFGNLFKSSKPKYTIQNTVWTKTIVKEAAILQLTMNSDSLLFLYFTDDTKNVFLDLFISKELSFSEKITSDAPIILFNANDLKRNLTIVKQRNIIFLDHAFSYIKEKEILDLLHEKLDIKSFVFYISFDDLIFNNFNTQSLKSIFNKLGFKETDSIQHSMIDNSIKKLQEKFDSEK